MRDHLLTMGYLYKNEKNGYQFLFGSHLHHFLYILYTSYVLPQSQSTVSQDTKTLTRLKDIITYVERHYMEPPSRISQTVLHSIPNTSAVSLRKTWDSPS